MNNHPIIVMILILILCFVLSWAVTCGIVFAIFALLGKAYTWRIGTLAWLVLVLIGGFVHN